MTEKESRDKVDTNQRCSRDRNESFEQLAMEAFQEFANLSDYVWKSPGFLRTETARERRKLDTYFPATGDRETQFFRLVRQQHEKFKLGTLFPELVAAGNFFNCLSRFETYCRRLLAETERLVDGSASRTPKGIYQVLEAFRSYGVRSNSVDYYEQTMVAARIRNCLIHANGLLAASTSEAELRAAIASGAFFWS